MTIRRHLLPLAALALLCPRHGAAQEHAGNDYVVDQWTAETGLPQNSVNAITQTPDGYLWLTTFGGLVRFDGVTFTLYSAARYPGIHSDRALGICVAPDSSLWVGTEDGLTHYARGHFESITTHEGLPPGPILGISCDPSGDVWLAMDRQGVVQWHNGRARHFPLGHGASGVNTIVADGHGNAWLGLWFQPPMLLRPTDSVVVARPQDAPPGAIGPMPRGSVTDSSILWRTADGVWIRDGRGFRRVILPAAILHQYAALAIPRSDGGLWVAEYGGVAGVDPAGHYAFYAVPGVGVRFRTRSIFTDRQGTTWVGTETAGLLRLRHRLFTVLTTDDGLSSDLPMGITGDDEGRVYIGSNCQNLTVLDHGHAEIYDGHRAPHLVSGCPWALLHGPGDTVWIGTYGGPVLAWHGRTVQVYGEAQGLPTGLAVGLYLDHHGELWAGTLTAGLAHLHRGRFIAYDTASGLPSDGVNVITETRAGTMWVGTTNGVARRDGDRFTSFTSAAGLAKGPIRSIYEAPDGALWFGSYGGGMSRLKDGRFVTLTTDDGLFEDVVSSITPDAAGYLWTSGNHGIARVSLQELNAFADGRIRAVHAVGYGTADGLVNPETNGGFSPNAWKAPDGRIWFPTLHGVAIVDPARAITAATPPTVEIEGISVDGREWSGPRNTLAFDAGTRSVDVTYTGLKSTAPEALAFRYRLSGDADWTYAGARRTAYFFRPAPGQYQFEVAAAGRDGVWSAVPARITFTIVPPIWARGWFRILCLAAVATAIFLTTRQRLARARAQTATQREFSRRVLDGQEQERRRIASELHDSVGQGILVMKNRAVLGLRATNADGARAQLEQISEIASETLNETRAIAHNLRPYQLDRLGLAATVRGTVERAAAGTGIAFTLDVEDVDGALPSEAEIGLFRIIQEGVNNVIRHSEARNARVTLTRQGDAVRLVVNDDGRGVDAPAGFGLAGISQRVQLLGGIHEMHSEPGGGTTLMVRIPIPARRQ